MEEGLDAFFDFLDFLVLGLPGFDFGFGSEFEFGALGGGKDALESVIIFGGNGVEFVVVALGAGGGEGEEAACSNIDAVVCKFG